MWASRQSILTRSKKSRMTSSTRTMSDRQARAAVLRGQHSRKPSLDQPQDAVVVRVDDVEDALRVDVHAVRAVEFRVPGRTGEVPGAWLACAGDPQHSAVLEDIFADHV